MKRLVVLRALKLGDFLTGIPALRALSRAFPDHERILAAPAGFGELLHETGMTRLADTPDMRPLDPGLSRADIAVDLHGRGPESQRLVLDTRPRRLISFGNPAVPETAGFPKWRPEEHEVHRWCRMLEQSGVPADPTDLHLAAPRTPVPEDWLGATVVHPGAASRARRWPAERFAEVARAEKLSGRRVVLTGNRAERPLAARVARLAGLPQSAVVAGDTSLTELAALVGNAGRVVAGDTGVAHMATATRTPSVVLFGPVPPSEWGPPPHPRHIALWAGRRGDPHGHRTDPGLLEIAVEEVLEALGRLTLQQGDLANGFGRVVCDVESQHLGR